MANFTLPSGYVVTIDDTGISSIKNGATEVANDGLHMIDGHYFYDNIPFVNYTYVPTISSKSVAYRTDGATVTHIYAGAVKGMALYQYTITGDVVNIRCTFTNDSTEDFNFQGFRSPFFLFDSWDAAKASSNQLGYDSSHVASNANNGIVLSYPMGSVPLGATYVSTTAASVPLNYCVWSNRHPRDWYMTIRGGASGHAGSTMDTFFFQTIHPRASGTFDFSYLFSSSTDWEDLLTPYKTWLRTARPIQYEVDARPWIFFASIGTGYVREDNPYGYNDGGNNVLRRFDLSAGVTDFLSRMTTKMLSVNYQGIMFWQPQGINPRGVQYRPDFDVWPTDSIANIDPLFDGFTDLGLRVGLQTRPGVAITSSTYDTDGYIETDERHGIYDDLENRIDWAIAKNVSAFYMDSFLTNQVQHDVLRKLRDHLGSSIQLFTESPTILSISDAGIYMDFTYSAGVYHFPADYERFRFIYPEVAFLPNYKSSLPPGGYTELYTYMFDNKLTGMVEDNRCYGYDPATPGTENYVVKTLLPTYVDGSNQWI